MTTREVAKLPNLSPETVGGDIAEKVPRPHRPSAAERLANPDAVLSRTDLAGLGYERRAVDAIFRGCDVIVLPGYTRPLIRVADYNAFLERCRHDGRNRVR